MKRRTFFKTGTLSAIGASIFNPFSESHAANSNYLTNKKAKNIILLVSDGMSTGTLNMADLYLSRKTSKGSNWLELYKEDKVSRALMDTASASSIVTDSAAASSSWGGGIRVSNGSLNVGKNGEFYLPLWQKFKKSGKKVGTVTTVPATHATPAGVSVNSKSRNAQDKIAEYYLEQNMDVIMGGGNKYFAANSRKDHVDMYNKYESAGYHVGKSRKDLHKAPVNKSFLGIFDEDALPYSIDRNNDKQLVEEKPTLAEMTKKAIELMKDHSEGFVLLVEAGKVDWAAHGNDIGGLLYDQLAFDDAVGEAISFAETNQETLVIITTDHGNANPGLVYGKDVNANFDSIQNYKHSNEWILNGFGKNSSISQIKERINYANNIALADDEAKAILNYYNNLEQEGGLYNPKKLPFKVLADIQKNHNSVGWISMNHSADYVELAMYGPGSQLLNPFIKNTDLHYIMLEAAEVENNF